MPDGDRIAFRCGSGIACCSGAVGKEKARGDVRLRAGVSRRCRCGSGGSVTVVIERLYMLCLGEEQPARGKDPHQMQDDGEKGAQVAGGGQQ